MHRNYCFNHDCSILSGTTFTHYVQNASIITQSEGAQPSLQGETGADYDSVQFVTIIVQILLIERYSEHCSESRYRGDLELQTFSSLDTTTFHLTVATLAKHW